MYNSDNQRIQHLRGLLSIFSFQRVGKALYQCVVKDEVQQDKAGSLVPKWFSGAQAPTIHCKACTTTSCSGAYNTIQYNGCTATRCSGAYLQYNTIQCLYCKQVLRRLQYNTMLGLRPGAQAPNLLLCRLTSTTFSSSMMLMVMVKKMMIIFRRLEA